MARSSSAPESMEADHQLTATVTAAASGDMPVTEQQQQQQQQMVAVAAPPATENADAAGGGGGGGGGDNGDHLPPTATSLLGGARRTGLHLFVLNARSALRLDELGAEVLRIAVPASLALTADPLASLIDTAFIGRIGSVEIAAVGVAIAVFNQVMKVCIYPLVSVTTSFVAEEDAILSKGAAGDDDDDDDDGHDAKGHGASAAAVADLEKQQVVGVDSAETNGAEVSTAAVRTTDDKKAAAAGVGVGKCRRRFVPSVTSALIVGAFLGLLQAVFLVAAGKPLLRIMGVKPGSPMMIPALRYLVMRSLGAPAVLLSLAMQGVFRGFKDTKTPLYATVTGDLANIALDPILIFTCRFGVVGAAIAHVISQYLITLIMLCKLVRKVDVIPSSLKSLKFRRFLGCGFLLLARVVAVTFCVTLAASLAARHGATAMAAFQICAQVWLASSLLADGLAVAGQALLASAFAKKDHYKVAVTTARVLQLAVVLGVGLTAFLAAGMWFGAGVFTSDAAVISTIHRGVPFVAGTQTINTLAFVFDGVGVAAVTIPCLVLLSSHGGFVGIWIALAIYMSVRAFASTWRMGAARGPWKFLRK
uniref:Protein DETOXIFICATION n=1 Tax=Oryza nivara TaxID=4536 RepID=A0A0E0FXN4_ORYNI